MRTHCKDCVLREKGIFSRMHRRQINKITCLMQPNRYRKKQIVFLEGNASHFIFAVRSGAVKTFKTAEDGTFRILKILRVGDLLAFDAIYSNEYLYSAETLEDSEICAMPKDAFTALLRDDTDLAVELIKVLTRELEEARRAIRDLMAWTAPQKVAGFLLSLPHAPPPSGTGKWTITLPLTRKELSEMLALTPETVSRVLRRFEKQHIVEIRGRKIRVVDPQRLSAMTSGKFS